VGHTVISFDDGADWFPAGGEEPPEFTPYEAEHWVSMSGEIISHDPHLNEDGEALYRFLLSQAETPPTFVIHCRGTHDETRRRLVDKTDSRGRQYTDTEYHTETITDFDFKIEHQVPFRSMQWSVGDEEPAYRGRMRREMGVPGETTKADRDTTKLFKAWRVERRKRGLPPWAGPDNAREGRLEFMPGPIHHPGRADVLKSSWTLRQWADDYCQSRKIFKEFVYEKVIYGWDLATLEAAIRAAIKSTHYRGDRVDVDFESGHRTVVVRPNTSISRALSNPCLKFLLVITLIYPFIWLFQRFHRRGGGRWAVGGGAYALKKWAPVPEGGLVHANPEIEDTVEGQRMFVGEREGEWFRRWEGTIRRSVMGRKVEKAAMSEPDDDVTNWPASELDGI